MNEFLIEERKKENKHMNFDNRKFIGGEKDEETFEIARSNIGDINNRK